MGILGPRLYEVVRRDNVFIGVCREKDCVWETLPYKTKDEAKINVLLHRRVYH